MKRHFAFGRVPELFVVSSCFLLATGPLAAASDRVEVSRRAPLEMVDHEDSGTLGTLGLADAGFATREPDPIPPTAAAEPVADRAVEVIQERYPNRTVKIRREVTQDEQGNYLNHGSWKMYGPAGDLVAEGQYEMGSRTGLWTRWIQASEGAHFKNVPFNRAVGPFVSQANFRDGQLHGAWTIFDSKQNKLSLVTFRDGVRHGPRKLWAAGGQLLREMTYRDGALHGEVSELGPEGKLQMVATYQDGRRVAAKITTFKGGTAKKDEAMYLFAKLVPISQDDFWTGQFAEYESVGQDERHGRWISWYPNGQIKVDGHYEYDVPVGEFTWWHANGQKSAEGEYANGTQHGEWVWWHPNGQKSTHGSYTRGEQTGEWLTWNPSGKLDQHAEYATRLNDDRYLAEGAAEAGDGRFATQPVETSQE